MSEEKKENLQKNDITEEMVQREELIARYAVAQLTAYKASLEYRQIIEAVKAQNAAKSPITDSGLVGPNGQTINKESKIKK